MTSLFKDLTTWVNGISARIWMKWVKSESESLSRVWLFATPRTIVCQAPLSMGFSRQEYWSGLHSLLQGNERRELCKQLMEECLRQKELNGQYNHVGIFLKLLVAHKENIYDWDWYMMWIMQEITDKTFEGIFAKVKIFQKVPRS